MSDNLIQVTENVIEKIETKSVERLVIQGVGGVGNTGAVGAPMVSGSGVPSFTGQNGQSYLNAVNGDVYTYSTVSSSWSLVGNIKGAQGDQGLQGETNFKIETFTLNSTQILNKQIVLANTPNPASKTMVHVQSAPTQYYGVDFQVIGNVLDWSGLSFELTLEIGTNIVVTYLIT